MTGIPSASMVPQEFAPLVGAVQRNCHISDARHARDKTLCIYLLEMREFFRWEKGIPLSQIPSKDELGDWMIRREALWDELEDVPFESLPVSGKQFDPFDIDAVNRELVPQGLVYGAGIGGFRKPHFFLGQLLRKEQRDGLTIVVSDCEYARDITAFPAAMQNGVIYLRQESLRRWLCEKIELWGMKKADGALKAALECYGLNAGEDAALDVMLSRESETVILHEIGEVAADRVLGPGWPEMMAALNHKRAEVFARAVRDNLADCLSTLPALLEPGAECSLHFFFANLEGMRRALFPRLTAAYFQWRQVHDSPALREAVADGCIHWAEVGRKLIEDCRIERSQFGVSQSGTIESLEAESVL